MTAEIADVPVVWPHSPYMPGLAGMLEHVERAVWTDFHELASSEEVAAGGLRCAATASATLFAASRIDVLFFNRVVGFGLDADASEAELDEIVAWYRAAGVPRFFVQVSPAAQPPTLHTWLQERGFIPYNNWTKLYRGVEDPPEATTDLRIEVVGPEYAAAFSTMTARAFDWPPVAASILTRMVGRPGWRHYMAFDGDEPVAGAGLYLDGGCGYLGPAVTLPAYRGRGAQSAFIARRIRDAAAHGCRFLITETAEDRPDHPVPSFRNMRRFGFEIAYQRPNYLLRLA